MNDPETQLSEADMSTLINVARVTVEDCDREGLNLLKLLTSDQKKQLWGRLDPAARSALQQISREVAHV